ncbi:hypothetical protein JCM30471_34830 [Desulfuromonas carbonis]|uniref:spore coat protein U domain-containing protein n=1 Tax=Desulfuromonas sp. DDH964 TaxID=1823759 RepID=UPI00078EA799|nr:spore coat protein U domain-containing protein [Desulfuromonas sp. DDH964]AMV72846.1 hypothetical protein DBW_2517 [Desulfuromonas sp. DDH964]
MVTLRLKKLLLFGLATALLFAPGSLAWAAPVTVAISATILSKSNCQFQTTNAALNFGTLDPTNPVNKTVNAIPPVTYTCRGSAPVATFLISDDDGLYELGPNGNRMRHATALTAFLPYSLSLSPATGSVAKNTTQTLTVTGTILGTDYQTAIAGSYSDQVTLTITP